MTKEQHNKNIVMSLYRSFQPQNNRQLAWSQKYSTARENRGNSQQRRLFYRGGSKIQ